MGLTKYPRWRRFPSEEKKDLIVSRLPQMLEEHFPEGVDLRMFKKLKEKTARELVHTMSITIFEKFARQAEHAPSRYICRDNGHRSNVVYEMRIRITGSDTTDATGMTGSAQNCLPD